jgi:hypothetical protein
VSGLRRLAFRSVVCRSAVFRSVAFCSAVFRSVVRRSVVCRSAVFRSVVCRSAVCRSVVGWFSLSERCSVVAADCTGGPSRVKGAFGVGFADRFATLDTRASAALSQAPTGQAGACPSHARRHHRTLLVGSAFSPSVCRSLARRRHRTACLLAALPSVWLKGRFRKSFGGWSRRDVPKGTFGTLSLNPPMLFAGACAFGMARRAKPASRAGRAAPSLARGGFGTWPDVLRGPFRTLSVLRGPLETSAHAPKAPLARLRTLRVRAGATRPAPARSARAVGLTRSTQRTAINQHQDHRWIQVERPEGHLQDMRWTAEAGRDMSSRAPSRRSTLRRTPSGRQVNQTPGEFPKLTTKARPVKGHLALSVWGWGS